MIHLPQVIVGAHPITSWANKVNQAVTSSDFASSPDIKITKTSKGASLRLNPKYKVLFENTVYRGEWSLTKGYQVNEIVRVLPEKAYSDSGGNPVKTLAGVYICVATVPDLEWTEAAKRAGLGWESYPQYMRKDDVAYYPQWPEPAELATTTTADGRYWELLSLLPTEQSVCVNGVSHTYYVDASEKPDEPTEED